MRIKTIGFWLLLVWGLPGIFALFILPDGKHLGFNSANWYYLSMTIICWFGAILYEYGYRKHHREESKCSG